MRASSAPACLGFMLLAAVTACVQRQCLVQGNEMLRPASLKRQPFVVKRMMPGPGDLLMRVTLHLVEAIQEQYRKVEHTCTISIAAPERPPTACPIASDEQAMQKNKRRRILVEQCERVTAVTQQVHYN